MNTKTENTVLGVMLVVLLATGVGHADLSDGLVGYWSFDHPGNLAHDYSGNANHGTVYGAVSTAGMVGNAMSFDGDGDYVVVADSDELDLTSSFTLSFWLNSGSSNESILLSKHVAHTDKDGSWIVLHPARTDPTYTGHLLMYNWSSPSGNEVVSETQIQQGEWVHWAITYDASTNACTFYADGEVDATHTYTFDIRNISRPLTIGGGEHFQVPYVRYFYEGLMDEVRIYNRALTGTEIEALSSGGIVVLVQDLAETVIELNLHNGIANSLDAKLGAVLQVLDDLNENNDVAAINALGAFINAVEAQRGDKIPEEEADTLIEAAQLIIDLLTNG